jgi:hypothetical protein
VCSNLQGTEVCAWIRDWHGYMIPGTRPGIPSPGWGQGSFHQPGQYPYPKHRYRRVFRYVYLFSLSYFFLLTSSFAARLPRATFLADGHGCALPRGPTRPHSPQSSLFFHPQGPQPPSPAFTFTAVSSSTPPPPRFLSRLHSSGR